MNQPENFYSLLGVTKMTSDADVRQAYNVLVESLRAKTTPDTQAQAEQRKQLLDEALHTLLSPEKRRRHDEKLDWHVAKSRIAADRAREAEMRLKQAQEEAEHIRQAALAAEKAAALEAVRRQSEEAKRQEELARIEAEAEERFRRLREERLPFMDTDVPSEPAEDHVPTEPTPLVPQEEAVVAAPTPALTLKTKIAWGALAFLVLCAIGYGLLRLGRSTAPPAPAAVAVAPRADSAQSAASAPAPQEAADTTAAKAPPAAPATTDKSAKADSAKAAEQQQYLKVLRQVEAEHPELNADRPGHRPELMAFVSARVAAHVKEGYPRAKALQIAVRDLETQEQTRRMLEKFGNGKEKPQVDAPVVLDKGDHPGFDPKCRWVTPEQWSCK